LIVIELRGDTLAFSFPEVHPLAKCEVDFQRTLRIPDDNQPYPLPAGLGRFPLHHVDDYRAKLPEPWRRHGGVFLPMYQAEALWVNFPDLTFDGYPCAVKIGAGKINAISGSPWRNELMAAPQDYVVAPSKLGRWLCGGRGPYPPVRRHALGRRLYTGPISIFGWKGTLTLFRFV
jgi:hypothetical protein